MEAIHIKETLTKQIAFLHGGRDRIGHPLIIFPSPGEWMDYPISDVTASLTYLMEIPQDPQRSKYITVIIDMRHASTKYLKTVLRAIQLVSVGRVKQVIIVKPEQFLEKSKLEIDLRLEVYEFKIILVSAHKLNRYVDPGQLPPSLGGTFSYDHAVWLDLRLRYESFIRDGSQLLKRCEAAIHETASPDLKIQRQQQSLTAEVKEIVTRGNVLIPDLKAASTKDKTKVDSDITIKRVETLIKQIEDSQGAHRHNVQKKSKEKGDVVFYEQFMKAVDNLSNWLLGPGEKWLLTLHEVGDSLDEAEQLQRDHHQLESKSQEVLDQAEELKELADHLIATDHPYSNDVKKRKQYLDTLTGAFMNRVRKQRGIIQLSVQFHRLVDQFMAKLDKILEALCSVSYCQESEAESVVKDLDMKMEEINKSYEEVSTTGQHFLGHLNVRDDENYEIARNYLPGVVLLKQTLADVEDRKFRCSELADVQRLKLQQIRQLHISERDADQAIRWINELTETLVTQHNRIGTGLDEVGILRQDHRKLEETARSTYDYGRELLQVSLVLRRSCRLDISTHHDLQSRLEKTWSTFCRALTEHAARLNISWAYYTTLKQVEARLDDLANKLSSLRHSQSSTGSSFDLRSSHITDITTERFISAKRQLREDLHELREMSSTLAERAAEPLLPDFVPSVSPVKDNEGIRRLEKTMEDIESRHIQLENSWEPLNSLVRRMTLDDTAHDDSSQSSGYLSYRQRRNTPPPKPFRSSMSSLSPHFLLSFPPRYT